MQSGKALCYNKDMKKLSIKNQKLKIALRAASGILIFAALALTAMFFIRLDAAKIEAISLASAFLVAAIVSVLLVVLLKKNVRYVCYVVCGVFLLFCLFLGIGPVIALNLTDTAYDAPTVQRSVFQDKKVLVVVPHQDDDLNLMAGVTEQYIAGGSQVKIVFTTHGDYYDLAATRIQEALAVAAFYGIPSSDVIFMGYGDDWDTPYGHIYNAPGDEVVTSHNQKTATYAAGGVEPYRYEDYTRNNYLHSLEDIIAEYMPDTIFAIDYDFHADHKATSLFFEEALGNVLKENAGYHPDVFKGFGYSTAWYAEKDFYADNVPSTKCTANSNGYMTEVNYYEWDDRVRFPVSAESLAYTLKGSSTYYAYSLQVSQNAAYQAGGVINSDKVYFRRDTSSLLYDATFSVSSNAENAYKLNDFKIVDDNNVSNERNRLPCDGAWTPSSDDKEKTVTVTLSSPQYIGVIRLYDTVSLSSLVYDAVVSFDDGTSIQTGELRNNGKGTDILFPQKLVSSFTVKILGATGENYGFSEIEAFQELPDYSADKYVKIMDDEQNFAYEYTMTAKTQAFELYGYLADTALDNYEITTSGEITAEIRDNRILVSCKAGGRGALTVKSKTDESVYDSIAVSRPNVFSLAGRRLAQKFLTTLNFDTVTTYYRDLYNYVRKVL